MNKHIPTPTHEILRELRDYHKTNIEHHSYPLYRNNCLNILSSSLSSIFQQTAAPPHYYLRILQLLPIDLCRSRCKETFGVKHMLELSKYLIELMFWFEFVASVVCYYCYMLRSLSLDMDSASVIKAKTNEKSAIKTFYMVWVY